MFPDFLTREFPIWSRDGATLRADTADMSCIVTLVRAAQVIWTMLGDGGTGEAGGPANKAVLPSDFLTRG